MFWKVAYSRASSRGIPDGGGGGGGTNAERIATALDGYTVPFSYTTPADPVESSTATVNSSTLNANIVAGRTLTLQTDTYGSPTFNQNNQDIIVSSNSTFTGMTISGNGCRITGLGGVQINGLMTISSGVTDLVIDNVTLTMSGASDSIIPHNWSRVAFLNFTLDAQSNWGMIGGEGCGDVLILRSDMQYTGATSGRCPMRWVAADRLIVVNSRGFSTQQGWRFHNNTAGGAMQNLVVARCQLEGNLWIQPGNGAGDGDEFVQGPVWVIDNNTYRDGQTQTVDIGTQGSANLQNATVTGHRSYCDATPGSDVTVISLGAGSSASNNLNSAYVSTPAFPYGAS